MKGKKHGNHRQRLLANQLNRHKNDSNYSYQSSHLLNIDSNSTNNVVGNNQN